jgi:hypothetical protein
MMRARSLPACGEPPLPYIANEWSAIAAYKRLTAFENHPVLSALLERIVRQETRHVAFYATQARDPLARSAKAQRLVRFALRRSEVRSGERPVKATNRSRGEASSATATSGPNGMPSLRYSG